MKNLIITIASLTIMSTGLFAQETAEIKKGVVREITCNGPTGLGMLKLETVTGFGLFGKTHHSEWLKVNSKKLCATEPGKYSFLSSLGFDAVFTGETYELEIRMVNGFVVDAERKDKVDYMEFTKNVDEWKVYNVSSSHDWFHQGPTYVDYYSNEQERAEAVEKFTSQEFLDSVSKDYYLGR